MSFVPPALSLPRLEGVDFSVAINCTPEAKALFDAFDVSAAGQSDPNRCKALLQFPNGGPVFWSSKTAVDADGPAAGPGLPNGRELDPGSGQVDTTLHFSDGGGLPSATIPYIVLPQGRSGKFFHPDLVIGDLAIVIFGDKITAAVCGDLGPHKKIGEASIRVHETLGQRGLPDPCSRRDQEGNCLRIRNASVGQDVLFFVFPNSSIATHLTKANAQNQIGVALSLYDSFRSAIA
jgi:hypothetical protein